MASIIPVENNPCSICLESLATLEEEGKDVLSQKIKELSLKVFPKRYFSNKNVGPRKEFVVVANQLKAIKPSCSHEFHTPCINKWKVRRIEEGKEFNCPLCRATVNSSDSEAVNFSSVASQLFFRFIKNKQQCEAFCKSRLFTNEQLRNALTQTNTDDNLQQTLIVQQALSLLPSQRSAFPPTEIPQINLSGANHTDRRRNLRIFQLDFQATPGGREFPTITQISRALDDITLHEAGITNPEPGFNDLFYRVRIINNFALSQLAPNPSSLQPLF